MSFIHLPAKCMRVCARRMNNSSDFESNITTDLLFSARYSPFSFTQHVCVCVLTWEVVHEAGLSGYDPFRPRLAENGDVTEGLLTQRGETAAKPLRENESVLVRQPVIIAQNHLAREMEIDLSCVHFQSNM